MKKILLIGMSLLAAGTLLAKTLEIVSVTTYPKMHCSNCEKKIKNFFRFEKGIKRIETDLNNQSVTITYDADKTSEEKILNSFSKINYEVEKLDSIQ